MRENLALISYLHQCKLTTERSGRGHKPTFFTLQASYQHLHRAQCCNVQAICLKELREAEQDLGSSRCLFSSGLALGWSGSPTTAWSCPAVVPGAASAVALPWCSSSNHSLFVLQVLNTSKASKSGVFNEDCEKKKESESFILYQPSPWLLQLIPIYRIFRGLRRESSFGTCS